MTSKTVSLGDIIELRSGSTPSKGNAAFWGGETPWVTAKDMGSFLIADSEDRLTDEGLSNGSRLVPEGAVLILTRGMTLHKRVPISRLLRPASFNQDVKAVLPKSAVFARFLPYLLLGNHDRIHRLVDSAGHGTGRLNTASLLALTVTLPEWSQQVEIAELGEAIDDRLQQLRNTSATLVSICEAVFKDWFANRETTRVASGDEPLDIQAPDSWARRRLGDFCELVKGCSYKGQGLSVSDGAFMFNLGCFNAHRVFATENVKRYTGAYRPRHVVGAGDLIIANTDVTQTRDILGRPALVPDGFEPGFISHHVFKVSVRADSERYQTALRLFLFFFLQQPAFRERAVGFATGTTVLALPPAAFLETEVCMPPDELLLTFADIVTPMLAQVLENERLAQGLLDTRSTLLPRLVSGSQSFESEHEAIGKGK